MIIYLAKSPSNKIYIGCTSRTLSERKKSHKSRSKNPKCAFHYAIQKYGFDSISWDIIDRAETFKQMLDKEIFYIDKYNTYNVGYNSTLGGEGTLGLRSTLGTKRTEEQILKAKLMSRKTVGKPVVCINIETDDIQKFNSIAECCEINNFKYTQTKNAVRTGYLYGNYKILLEKNYDPTIKYKRKPSHNSKSGSIVNIKSKVVHDFKSICELSRFLSIGERRARNMYYKNKVINDWKVINE
jgi:group I intron endonuclease